MALNITRGKQFRAQKVVIYGPEGVGKTTLAADCPEPLFIDTEGGTSHLEVSRIDPAPRGWNELISIVNEVARGNYCKALVIDTADWAERIAIEQVCTEHKIKSIEALSYSKGYTYLAEEFLRLIAALDSVVQSGIHVVIIAHAQIKKFEQPDEMGAYDRWELKLTRKVAQVFKEWADAVLFLNFETKIISAYKKGQSTKGTGGKERVMHTSHAASWDAKNRYGMRDKVPMSFSEIAFMFQDPRELKANRQIISDIRAAADERGLTESIIMELIHQKWKGKVRNARELADLDDAFLNNVLQHIDKFAEWQAETAKEN